MNHLTNQTHHGWQNILMSHIAEAGTVSVTEPAACYKQHQHARRTSSWCRLSEAVQQLCTYITRDLVWPSASSERKISAFCFSDQADAESLQRRCIQCFSCSKKLLQSIISLHTQFTAQSLRAA